MILPEYQSVSLGTALQKRMIEYAKSKGFRGFTAFILTENTKMLKLAVKKRVDRPEIPPKIPSCRT